MSETHNSMLPSWRLDDSLLLQVVPGPDHEVDYMGGKLRLLLLEIYEEGLAITWRIGSVPRVDLDEPDERGRYGSRFRALPFLVTDDQGTQYKAVGGMHSAGRHHANGRFYCAPPAPLTARWVTVSLEDIVFSFDLAAFDRA